MFDNQTEIYYHFMDINHKSSMSIKVNLLKITVIRVTFNIIIIKVDKFINHIKLFYPDSILTTNMHYLHRPRGCNI